MKEAVYSSIIDCERFRINVILSTLSNTRRLPPA
jgi:hypothetical protein